MQAMNSQRLRPRWHEAPSLAWTVGHAYSALPAVRYKNGAEALRRLLVAA